MSRIFEYFVVCGIGPEIRSIDGNKGYHGPGWMYLPFLLDQFPPSTHSLYPPPPPQLPTCVLPAGVEFHASGFDPNDPSTFPRSYPIVLTEGDGSKIYVSCISFRDHVCEDVIEAYRIQGNSYADKCICLVSRSPCFSVLRSTLEELFVLCFSPTGSSKPLWDIIAHTVSNVPLPTPGKERVLFAIENCLLSVEAPPNCGLPHVDISFQPLVQCLDVDNLINLFTAVLLERRILLRANKYSLLTLASEAICHLIYPFRWQHVYIPLLFYSGVDYIDAPTPYMMGLHSGVDTTGLTMDGALEEVDKNFVTMRTMLSGDGESEPNLDQVSQLVEEICKEDVLTLLIHKLPILGWEARKDLVHCWTILLKQKVDSNDCCVEYIQQHIELLDFLVACYDNKEIALSSGIMLRECIKFPNLAKYILESASFVLFFKYVELPNFDVASDAFSTFKDLLSKHATVVAEFLTTHYDEFFDQYEKLLTSPNYVTRRQSIKLLSDFLLESPNAQIMKRYILEVRFLKVMMTLLTDSSKNIQLSAFHIFKIFVANPNKPRDVKIILGKNKGKLLELLHNLSPGKGSEDEQFEEEKEFIIKEIERISV